jgi:hypothetical protein
MSEKEEKMANESANHMRTVKKLIPLGVLFSIAFVGLGFLYLPIGVPQGRLFVHLSSEASR